MGIKDMQVSESRRNLFRRFGTQEALVVTAGLSEETVGDRLLDFGISRRGFMQFCAGMAAMMSLPPATTKAMAAGFLNTPVAKLKPVIYMSFQECTGCLESLVNLTSLVSPITPQPADLPYYTSSPIRIAQVLLTVLSLEYQETIMAAAGKQAEEHRARQIAKGKGRYILVVDGSIPASANSGYFVSAGQSGVARFMEAAEHADAIVAVGTCASFGGIPHARPNPTGARSIYELLYEQNGVPPNNLINIPGCPPIAEVIAAVLYYYITQGLPELDGLLRPKMFYGLTGVRDITDPADGLSKPTVYTRTVHSDCLRDINFRDESKHAHNFDDLREEEKRLYCLRALGCKGPRTYNACTTVQWNQGTSYPMKSGHHCIGCAEPNFWDGVYTPPPLVPGATAAPPAWPTWTELMAFTANQEESDGTGTTDDTKIAFRGLYEPY